MNTYKKYLILILFILNNSLITIFLITISPSCTTCVKNTLTLRLNSKKHSKSSNNAAGNFFISKVSSKSNFKTHTKPSNSSLQDSFLTKVLISTWEEPSVSYLKETKEKTNKKSKNITTKKNLKLKIHIFSMTKLKINAKKSIFKFLYKIVSKTYKNLFNSKIINKKSHFGSQNSFSLIKLLIKQQEHCKKYKINALNCYKLNFGWISMMDNLMNVGKLET